MKKLSKARSRAVAIREPRRAKPATARLVADIRGLIEAGRQYVAHAVNAAMVQLYWHIGKRIREEVLHEERAEYGKRIVSTLSKELTSEYGSGYSEPNLSRMIRLAEVFPDNEILSALTKELSWTHFVAIIAIDDALKRDFYAEMCRIERWSTRTLRKKIDGMLYERTAISKKPRDVIQHDLQALQEENHLTPDLVFRDPYFLDFLGLAEHHNERDIEQAILRELEAFILELGTDFAFVARQKRITVDQEDYYLDLLFYHRRLRRLVAIDLKLGRFQAADKGQMELYLRWLQEYETQPGEESPIGLILCADKSAEHVRLLRLESSGIRVAQYLTELPPQKVLERKLRNAIRLAREQLARKAELPADTSRPSVTAKTGKRRKRQS